MRQFSSALVERRAAVRVHPDGRAIHNRVEKFMRQIGARHDLPSGGASQRAGAFRTPRANTYDRARLRQRERSRSRRASRAKQQHAAPREAHPLLQAAQDSDVVCIVPVQSPAATHDHGVDRSNARGERIAVVQRAQNRFLVRNRDRRGPRLQIPPSRPEILEDSERETAQIPRRICARETPCCAAEARANARSDRQSRRTRACGA